MAQVDNSQMIADIASKHMGVPPGQPPQQMTPPAPPPAPKADPAPTDIERAQSKIAPADSADASPATDMKFLTVGDREYTESQLKGMLARYPKANSELMMNKPIINIAQQLMEAARSKGHEPKHEEIAGLIDAAVKAYIKNPQMGGEKQGGNATGEGKQAMSADSGEDVYAQWEKENAVKLPPGFRETASKTDSMASQIQQMMGMFQQLMQGGMAGQNANAQAQQAQQAAQAMQGDAVTKMITGNLNQAFQQAGLQADPQSRSDFQMFAAQRGYDFPDFVDPQMTAVVVADYKAVKDAPEMQRMREVMSKRQAFTGVMENSPGSSGVAPAPAGDPMLAGLIGKAMSNRGMA